VATTGLSTVSLGLLHGSFAKTPLNVGSRGYSKLGSRNQERLTGFLILLIFVSG
jgi:hypothetical protein